MTRDEVMKLASMAGFETRRGMVWVDQWMVSRTMERFAAFVAAAEREACARVCDHEARMHEHLDRNGRSRHLDDAAVAETCAAAIRARGEK
jgi:hypothetical protein